MSLNVSGCLRHSSTKSYSRQGASQNDQSSRSPTKLPKCPNPKLFSTSKSVIGQLLLDAFGTATGFLFGYNSYVELCLTLENIKIVDTLMACNFDFQ
jgi:hypothetical protein